MKINYLLLLVGSLTFATACVDTKNQEETEIEPEVIDHTSSLNTAFDGKIFSVPSPVQTALLIKSASPEFHKELLNDNLKIDQYNTEFARALNLGIYGADLGYASLYDQKSITREYLSTVEKLTSELGLEGAFDKRFVQRYEDNLSDQDSMMFIVSEAFRNADLFLKNSNRKATSTLILTGGWIESMHFACELNGKKRSEQIIERIGEQTQTLSTIIEILEEYNKMGSNDELIAQLKDLRISFDDVAMNYEFVEPETNTDNRKTILKHRVSFDISDEVLTEIATKIAAIRNTITA